MPLTADQYATFSAALNRLATFYDGDHAYNPATYPGALRQGGSVINFVPALKDVATVMSCASILVADATAASGASPKALRVDSAQSFQPSERGQARSNLKLPASTFVYSSGNRSLTKDDVGTVFYTDSTQTITIPLLSDCVVGDTVEFWVAAGTLTLAQPAGNSNPIGIPGSAGGQTVALTAGAYSLKRHDNSWRLHTPPNNAVQRSGDTMTGDLTLSSGVLHLGAGQGSSAQVWRGISANDGSFYVQSKDGASGTMSFKFGTDGTLAIPQFGDLNSRIEARGQAYSDAAVNRSVTYLRLAYIADQDITAGANQGMVESYGGSMITGRTSITSGDGNDIIVRNFRFRQMQFNIPNSGWIAAYYA